MAASRNGLTALVLALLTVGVLIVPLCQAAAAAADGPGNGDGEAAAVAAAEPLITAAELRKARPPRQRTRATKTPPPPPKSTSSGPVTNAKPPPPNGITFEGGLSIIFREISSPLFVFDSSDGVRIPLFINQTDAEKYLGYKIRIRLTPQDLPAAWAESEPVPVQDIQIIGTLPSNSQQKEEVGPGGVSQVLIKPVIYTVSACGYPAAISPSALRNILVNGPNTPSDAVTMQNAYNYCSQGRVVVNNSNVDIIEVKLPCTGTTTSPPVRNFNFTPATSSCSMPVYLDMMRIASDYVKNVLGRSLAKDQSRMLVVPRELAAFCDWSDQAYIIPTATSEAFINGVYANDLTPYMRLLGFTNFYLSSARGEPSDFNIDQSSVMGRGRFCFNAPNLWRLGWVSPLPGGDLNGTTLTIGRPRAFFLPGQNTNPQSYLRINPTWAITGKEVYNNKTQLPLPVFFVAHRYQESALDTFSPPTSSIYVHSYKGTKDRFTIDFSYRVAVLTGTSRIYRGPYGLVVRLTSSVTSWFGGNATVVICRASGEMENVNAESCSDGLDNDCDGRVDAADSDCANAIRAPSPSPPRRQPSTTTGSSRPTTSG